MHLLNHGFDVFHGSVPIVKTEHITSIRINGPGCFVLFENQNYRNPMMKVYEGLTFPTNIEYEGLTLSTNISVIRSIQYWYDCPARAVMKIRTESNMAEPMFSEEPLSQTSP